MGMVVIVQLVNDGRLDKILSKTMNVYWLFLEYLVRENLETIRLLSLN